MPAKAITARLNDTEDDLLFLHVLAERLHKSVEEIRRLGNAEILAWHRYYMRSHQMKQMAQKAGKEWQPW